MIFVEVRQELKWNLFEPPATGVFQFWTEFLIWNRSTESGSNFKRQQTSVVSM